MKSVHVEREEKRLRQHKKCKASFFSLLAVYPWASLFNRDPACLDCGNKSGVILPGLVGVRLGEGSNSALESIVSPQVATDLGRVAGARMGTGESPATEPAIVDETLGFQTRDIHGQLHISQLANIKVDGVRFRPPKEEITGGLHDMLSTDDPLTMARIGTGAEVTFEGHNHCRAAQKAKGRGSHATVADRHELCLPGQVLLLQQADGV